MNTDAYINITYLIAGDFLAVRIRNSFSPALSQDRAFLLEILQKSYRTSKEQIEGYNDRRRTIKEMYIRTLVPLNFGSQYPKRYIYPQFEIETNTSIPNSLPTAFDPS